MLRTRSLAPLTTAIGLALLVSCGSTTPAASPNSPNSPTSPTSTTTSAPSAGAGYQMLTPAAAAALLQQPPAGLVLLDVRTPSEFAAGHLTGAVDLDLNGAGFAAGVAKLDPKASYFVYCHSGNRSAQAVAYLQRHAFSSIYELQGGISAWQTAGLPVVTG